MTIAVDAVVYYRVSDPMMSVINILNVSYSTRLLAQTTLRNILGQKTLTEILVERDIIANSMQVNQFKLIFNLVYCCFPNSHS